MVAANILVIEAVHWAVGTGKVPVPSHAAKNRRVVIEIHAVLKPIGPQLIRLPSISTICGRARSGKP